MNKEEYAKLVKKYTPSEDKLKHTLIAFVVGGIIGILACFIYNILMKFDISTKDANIWTLLIIIATSSLFTGFGFFDNWVSKTRCGLVIPITGFAHSVTSAALEYKKDTNTKFSSFAYTYIFGEMYELARMKKAISPP